MTGGLRSNAHMTAHRGSAPTGYYLSRVDYDVIKLRPVGGWRASPGGKKTQVGLHELASVG